MQEWLKRRGAGAQTTEPPEAAMREALRKRREKDAQIVRNLKAALDENGWGNPAIMAACDEAIAAILEVEK